MARTDGTAGTLLHRGSSVRDFSGHAPIRIGNGYLGYTSFGVTDWDRDGHQDLIARHDASGDLKLFPGSSARGYSSQGVAHIGSGYQGYTPFGAGDVNRDGHADLVVRNDHDGRLFAHYGRSVRGYSSGGIAVLQSGFNAYTGFGVVDYDGNGTTDVVARNNDDGNLYFFTGTGTRTFIRGGLTGYSPFGLTDWDRDGSVDLIARRDATLDLYLFHRASGATIRIGSGY